MEITVKTINGTDFKMQTTSQTSIMQLRQEIGRKLAVQSDRVRLIFNGRVLNNSDKVETYSIVDCSIIHCVIRPEQTPSAAPSASSGGSVSATTSRSTGATLLSTIVTPSTSASAGTARSTSSTRRNPPSASLSASASSSSSRPSTSSSSSSSGSQGSVGASASRGTPAVSHGAVMMGLGAGPNGGFFTTLGSPPPGFESMISDIFGGIPVQQSASLSIQPSGSNNVSNAQERLIAQAVTNVVGNALFGMQSPSGTTTATAGTTAATTSASTTTSNGNNNTVPTVATPATTTATPVGGTNSVPSATTSAAAPATPVQPTNGTPSNTFQYPRLDPNPNYYNMGMGVPYRGGGYSPYGSSPGSNMYPGSGMMPFAYQQTPMPPSYYGMNVNSYSNVPQQVIYLTSNPNRILTQTITAR